MTAKIEAQTSPAQPLSIIILAAGKGTRMRSALPKVLHEVGRRAMLHHVLALAQELEARECVVVIGPGMEEVAASARAYHPRVIIALQERQLGTGDAVRAALPVLGATDADILILFGDTPLISAKAIAQLRHARAGSAAIGVIGFRPADPGRYGRLVTRPENGALVLERIVEFAEASAEEREIGLCNSGIFLIEAGRAAELLSQITNANSKGEYYLTDIVEIALRQGLRTIAVEADVHEVLGVNSRADLAAAEAAFQARARVAALESGATLIAPDTVYFSADTSIESDVHIGPHVVFGPGVRVASGARIEAFSHIEGARIDAGARIGPFARLRSGAQIGAGVHVGNFVEVKNSALRAGAKANHLAYIGDADIGANANIGAGTITCNYDGFGKFETKIGAGAFIGSNSSLVAPVEIGAGAYVGSGSVITQSVPNDALAIGRGKQEIREGWAARFRERKMRETARKKGKE